MPPKTLPFPVIRLHDPSVDASPLSSEKIRKASLLLKRKTRQESFCNGKAVEKVCKNTSSGMVKVSAVAELRLNVRDEKSAMRLSTPAMETETSGDASFAWIRIAKARVRRPATCDREELSLFVQLTVGVLSHHAATWTCFKATRCSSTR
jgi:hypothetical protein